MGGISMTKLGTIPSDISCLWLPLDNHTVKS